MAFRRQGITSTSIESMAFESQATNLEQNISTQYPLQISSILFKQQFGNSQFKLLR